MFRFDSHRNHRISLFGCGVLATQALLAGVVGCSNESKKSASVQAALVQRLEERIERLATSNKRLEGTLQEEKDLNTKLESKIEMLAEGLRKKETQLNRTMRQLSSANFDRDAARARHYDLEAEHADTEEKLGEERKKLKLTRAAFDELCKIESNRSNCRKALAGVL